MKNILSEIVNYKKKQVTASKEVLSLEILKARSKDAAPRKGFFSALKVPSCHGANIIAEIKRASPSKGVIRQNLDAAQYAERYEKGGASAISVLTDEAFFKGHGDDLVAAREASSLPILRKEFIISEYQIYESLYLGADAILLIVKILTTDELKQLLALSRSLNLDALVEIHSEDDLIRATAAGAELIGINNRNLETFHTDIKHSVNLSSRLKPFQIPVAASGISSREDVNKNIACGIFNFLVGEHLVRSQSPENAIKELLGRA